MNQIEIKISNEEINYKEAVLFMESKVRDIIENHSKELLWFLSHNHIFTQGTSASDDEILNSDVIEHAWVARDEIEEYLNVDDEEFGKYMLKVLW